MASWVGPILMLLLFFFAGLAIGIPMAFTMGVGSIITCATFFGVGQLQFALTSTWNVMNSESMLACPMFIFMAILLEQSGVADDLYKALHHWMGGLHGGLAMATVIIAAIMGAMSGVAAAGTVTMALIALPIMLEKKYHKDIALGPILVGGPLGILIPPSVGFIIYGMLTDTSIGMLFAGGIMPGILLTGLYCLYFGIRCAIRPQDGPTLAPEERVSFKEKLKLTKGLVLPVLLVLAVLGSMFAGICSTSESAAVGALGAALCAVIHKKFSWRMFFRAAMRTLETIGMIVWILFGANVFSSTVIVTGLPEVIANFITGLHVPGLVIVLCMMFIYFILGMFLEETTMLYITVPIFMPILVGMGYDKLWFGIIFMISMQMAYITPPFGFSLFFLKGSAPEGVTTKDIYHAVPPLLLIQWVAVIICMIFPQVCTWLPNLLYR